MPLPIVSGTEIETPAASIHVDAQPFRQAAFAKGRAFAQGAEAVGDFFDDVGRKFQENKNAQTMLDADLRMRKFADTYRDSLAKNPDENTWVPQFQEQSDQLKEDILSGPNVGPQVKRQLSANLAVWQQAHTSEITTAAQLQSLNKTKQTGIENYTYALRQGDMEGAMNAIKVMDQAHALQPWDVERMKKEAPGIAQRAQVDTGIEANPKATYDKLLATDSDGNPSEFTALSPDQRRIKTREALSAMRSSQSETLKGLIGDYEADPSNIPSKESLNQKVKSGEISARGARNFTAMVEQKNLKEAKDSAAVIAMRVHEYDLTQDKNPEAKAAEWKEDAAALPPVLQKPIFEAIDNKLKKATSQGSKEEKPVERDIYARMKEDREENGLTLPMAFEQTEESKGFLGFGAHSGGVTYHHVAGGLKTLRKMSDEELQNAYGKDASMQKVTAAEELHYAQQLGKMRDWFKANPTATEEDAEKYRQSLERPYITAAASAALTKNHPTAVDSEDEYDALPSGAPFIWNGRMGVKN